MDGSQWKMFIAQEQAVKMAVARSHVNKLFVLPPKKNKIDRLKQQKTIDRVK